MKKKIRYIFKDQQNKINPELVKILGKNKVFSLLEDFKKFAHEIDHESLDGTFS